MSAYAEFYRLIAIADDSVLSGRNVVDACIAAARGGATSIQLRMKNTSASDFLIAAQQVVRSVSIPVFVNDRVDVAVLAGAAGAHLGADDIPPDSAGAIPGANHLLLGTSVGDNAEAFEANGFPASYWGCGPVFSTSNKADAGAAIGPDGLARFVELAGNIPVVAIGGINESNCHEAIEAGARGVAAIGSVFGASDVEGACRRLRVAVDRALSRDDA